MATIIIKDMPDELKRKFKAKCAENGFTLKEVLMRLMEASINGIKIEKTEIKP